MIVTNYGLDCALSQVVMFHHTGSMEFSTVSARYINDFLKKFIPSVLIGFNCIDRGLLSKKPFIIDTSKAGKALYMGYEKFITGEKISKTSLFAKAIRADMSKINHFCNLADAASTYQPLSDEYDSIANLYDSIGHDLFVYRMILNPDFQLDKTEQVIVAKHLNEKEKLCNMYMENFLLERQGIIVCRCPYVLQHVLFEKLREKREGDLVLVAFWDFTADGEVRVDVSSPTEIAGRVSEALGGNGYNRNGSFKLQMQISEDTSENVMTCIEEHMEGAMTARSSFYYDSIQAALEPTNNPPITEESPSEELI